MKKHFIKIIIGISFLCVLASGIILNIVFPVNIPVDKNEEPKAGKVIKVPEDYIISSSTKLLVNDDNYIHSDDTAIKGIVSKIVFDDEDLSQFIIESLDNKEYKIDYEDLDLISTDIVEKQDEDDNSQVNLVFRTGGKVKLSEGKTVYLYKTETGKLSLDKREQIKSSQIHFTGVIEDFEFLPTAEQEGDIYISHITVKNNDGEIVELYPHNLDANSIKTSGEMAVYYLGNILGMPIFDIKESDDFSLEISTDYDVHILEKGMHINLVQNEKKGYWEIGNEIDTKIYEATIDGFVFGHKGDDITSVDYINLSINENDTVQLTMMQTGALYAIPNGDYKKIYTYNGHNKSLTDVEPLEDWKMELYYEDDTVLELSVGTKVWIYKNKYDIWLIDYTYEEETTE